MNKSQELVVMQLRAKIKVDEAMQQYMTRWHGQEPEIIEGEKPEQEVDDGDN